jgi:histidine triad (HIT) family protein
MSLGELLFSIAKTPIGAQVAGATFAHFSRVLPIKRVYESDKVVAFWHPKPFWEKHILIVPKRKIKNIVSISDGDLPYVADVYKAVEHIVKELGWEEYTLLANGGKRQEVMQLHFHLWSGKQLD